MGPRVILLALAISTLLAAGCGNKEAEQTSEAAQPKPGSIQAQVQQSRPSSAVDTDAVPAPAGVRTDLKGGLK